MLFFILGHAAHLGTFHFIETARVGATPVETVFNRVVNGKDNIIVSVYLCALKAATKSKYDYAGESVFDNPVHLLPGRRFYSYK